MTAADPDRVRAGPDPDDVDLSGTFDTLSGDQQRGLAATFTPRLTPYIVERPTPRQTAFLLLDDTLEVFFGGSAFGGKSRAVLMAALQYVDVPGYAALILRQDYGQLSQPGALMDLAHDWLDDSDADWSEKHKRWKFPSGATLTFGYLKKPADRERYQGPSYQFIAWDEATQFVEDDYLKLFGWLRRPTGLDVPLRARLSSNPGGRGHAWVHRRFVNDRTRADDAVFLPSRLWDNPHVDHDEYVSTLRRTHPVTWRRLLYGDWEVSEGGEIYRPREWVTAENGLLVDDRLSGPKIRRVRHWDLAASEPTSNNPDPDYTAGLLLAHDRQSRRFRIEHVERFRHTPGSTKDRIAGVATRDGAGVLQHFEIEPGASGKLAYDETVGRLTELGIRVGGKRPTGSKETRAVVSATAMENGRISVVSGDWTDTLFDELEQFGTTGVHDDQVDALSGAFAVLTGATRKARSDSGSVADARLPVAVP